MKTDFGNSCSRFAVRSAALIFPQSKRYASHRDAATACKKMLSSRAIRIRKASTVL